ncbi:Dbl homology domain-containing protein [Pilobolus umbonatus]|nr:Dbl homology domain-containing protein [Pilobolus umbonatus]
MTHSTTTTTLNEDQCTTDSLSDKGPEPSALLLKRKRVINELIHTEKTYQTDMELIKDIYYNSAHSILSKHEIKQVFINLLDILVFEKEFIQLLEMAGQNDQMILENSLLDPDITIGKSFSVMMSRLEQIYGDYCKKHEDAVCKIQELGYKPEVNAYYMQCKQKIQGRTMCWDLPSLLIKPVQRILKYPLLLREITALTPESHPDYEQLALVTNEIQKVADHINEIKRRKDIVEQLIGEKKRLDRNVVQGINKRFTRRVHRKKQTATTDSQFDVLYNRLVTKKETLKHLEREIQEWCTKIQKNTKVLSDLVDSLEAVYGDSDGIGLRSIQAFRKLVIQSGTTDLEMRLQQNVFRRIESCLKLFKNPMHIIHKRNRKLIDYDRAQHLSSKGDVIDKQLQLSVEAYISINAHLLEELPIFLSLADKYCDIIIDEFACIQTSYWHKFETEWRTLTIELPFGREYTWSSIEVDYSGNMKKLHSTLNGLYSKPKETFDSNYSLQRMSSIMTSVDD